ncbi:GIY-YIG nuclease family protein [Lactococcus lactis]|uniref:GIY-YIG nuclease family protein n=1 Tax=Lactococcus lactis TaxID=1358 RepID=A0A9X4NJW6_9LACT|nr:GIY-YIG nuclease family protein [Lactococcus lactis]MDG4985112.1 GIY-YIG nuclease family protein [Lactococcus lactis]
MSDFPGYPNVLLSFAQLQQLARDNSASWVAALSNVKAVYLQTDLKTGKHYVGSASGNSNGLWQRWVQYANGDHTGGDCDLKKLVKEKNKEYIEENFQYSILEIFDTRVDFDNIISPREEFWKQALDSRKHGYNNN